MEYTYENVSNYSGYSTPDSINQHSIPQMYHNQGPQLHTMPSPPLSDSIPPTPTYPVTPTTSYIPTHNGHHYPQQYQQQIVPVSRGPVMPAGSRRRCSPDSPLILDPPPMRRPTLTSRKDHTHPYYPKRRPNVQVSDDDDDELPELPPNATDQQKIEHQRYRNTLAARRSRKRKELYKQELEQRVEQLTMETEKWRIRAEMLREMIESQGLQICPDWSE
ncbi:hypothetical protein E1B28_001890 [Marasmius oreades]|uniref:BZIP domain-containing protein n=1 Tax=Marasmius oreades TaxID=181124 RepID=A0A9P8AG94_9AGAR|nr:uncharacterized protein E1B28_001890 [Marasmius oreades]KAG7100110.1 hypothetical protein E1B28_001890 [Marasmius oreades]